MFDNAKRRLGLVERLSGRRSFARQNDRRLEDWLLATYFSVSKIILRLMPRASLPMRLCTYIVTAVSLFFSLSSASRNRAPVDFLLRYHVGQTTMKANAVPSSTVYGYYILTPSPTRTGWTTIAAEFGQF